MPINYICFSPDVTTGRDYLCMLADFSKNVDNCISKKRLKISKLESILRKLKFKKFKKCNF